VSALGHVLRLARIDAVRMVRKHTDTDQGVGRLVTLLVFALLSLATAAGGGYLTYRLTRSATPGDVALGPVSAMAALRGGVALFGLIGAVVVAIRAVGQRGTLTNAEGILTVVPTGQACAGLLLAEYVYALLWLAGPAAGVSAGLAAGTGTLSAVVTVPLGLGVLAGTAVAIGVPTGLAVRHAVSRVAFVVRHKTALIVVVFLGYLGLVVTGSLNAVLLALFEPMQAAPTGWVADLMLLGTPVLAPTVPRAVGAVGFGLALGAAGVAAGTRLAAVHWFSDPVLAGRAEPDPGPETGASGSATPGIERRLAPAVGVPTAALVALAWRRAARAPLKLLYAAYPLLFAVGVLADIVQTGRLPAYLPYGTVLFVTWAAGVIFTLNPLGDQGAVLPTTLLSRVDGRQFVRAHLLASLLIAVPVGVAVTAAVAVASPVDPGTAVALVVAAAPLMVVSNALSVGIGTAFPRFRAVNVTRSMKTVVPSTLAFVLFSLHLLATALSGVLVYDEGARSVAAGVLTWLLPFGLGVGPGGLFLVAAGLLAVLVAAPALSYRYAVRRFDRYTLD
jgi:hypothetical protein